MFFVVLCYDIYTVCYKSFRVETKTKQWKKSEKSKRRTGEKKQSIKRHGDADINKEQERFKLIFRKYLNFNSIVDLKCKCWRLADDENNRKVGFLFYTSFLTCIRFCGGAVYVYGMTKNGVIATNDAFFSSLYDCALTVSWLCEQIDWIIAFLFCMRSLLSSSPFYTLVISFPILFAEINCYYEMHFHFYSIFKL